MYIHTTAYIHASSPIHIYIHTYIHTTAASHEQRQVWVQTADRARRNYWNIGSEQECKGYCLRLRWCFGSGAYTRMYMYFSCKYSYMNCTNANCLFPKCGISSCYIYIYIYIYNNVHISLFYISAQEHTFMNHVLTPRKKNWFWNCFQVVCAGSQFLKPVLSLTKV